MKNCRKLILGKAVKHTGMNGYDFKFLLHELTAICLRKSESCTDNLNHCDSIIQGYQ